MTKGVGMSRGECEYPPTLRHDTSGGVVSPQGGGYPPPDMGPHRDGV